MRHSICKIQNLSTKNKTIKKHLNWRSEMLTNHMQGKQVSNFKKNQTKSSSK